MIGKRSEPVDVTRRVEVVDYDNIVAPSLNELRTEVLNAVRKGWTPQGSSFRATGSTYQSTMYVQTMILYEYITS